MEMLTGKIEAGLYYLGCHENSWTLCSSTKERSKLLFLRPSILLEETGVQQQKRNLYPLGLKLFS
jgi:hypothetical protein